MIKRYTYLNTDSMAGSPTEREIDPFEISHIYTWSNYYGNPSYVFHMINGDTHYLVDDYGALNDIGHKHCKYVQRKKDMFI